MKPYRLLRIAWRYLQRHPWQSLLMLIGITLGVAVVIAVDLANASASRAFDLSTEAVAGKATHQISGGPQGLPEGIYSQLRRQLPQIPMAPVVSEYLSSPELGDLPLQLLGVDPFAEPPFRNYLESSGRVQDASPSLPGSQAAGGLVEFLTQPNTIVISANLARRFGIQNSQTISLEINGRLRTVRVVGLIEPAQPNDRLRQQALDSLILTDIATAQELTGRLGNLDRIDLILSSNPADVQAVQALLPASAVLETVASRSGAVEQMTAAFRTNLTALSLLALVVGLFLIYNTITFSVVQRRPLFGTLRALGVTRREVFRLVLSEALIVGSLGALLGSLLGILLGQGAVRLVTQTINDLYFVLAVQGVQIPLSSLVKGGLLGILATLGAAAPPAWEAASVSPRLALARSGLESKAQRAAWLAAGAGLGMLFLGLLLLILPLRSLAVSFTATFLIVVGLAMQVPLLTHGLMRLITPVLGRLWGTLGRMAPRNVVSSLSRTAIAVMALMVAVSVTIGVSVMISSFRTTVVAWLEETLQGDIYISAPGLTATTPSAQLDPAALAVIRQAPEVAQSYVLRATTVASPAGPISIAATDNQNVAFERRFLAISAPPAQIWERMLAGAVLVSEPLANRLNLPRQNATLTLNTDQGPAVFEVAGIYYDYASTQGTVLMALPVYQQRWNDQTLTAMALRVQPGVDVEALARQLQQAVSGIQRLAVRPNQVLRQEVLTVFDRTFAITGALQLLSTVVAFIGVLSALLSLELERQRELGILRSIGLTTRQLWKLILLETGLMGTVAGLLAMPTGYVLALILVYIINLRSFGWTLQMNVEPAPFFQALAISVSAALLAGLYPAYRISRMLASEALRSE